MKLNRIITSCAIVAALTLSVGDVLAQNNGNGNGGGGGGGGGGRNFDPAAMQQRMVDNARDSLGFTNDTDWSAVEPLVQKVVAAQFDARSGQGRGGFGGRNRGGQGGQAAQGGQGGQGGGRFGQPSPEADALRKAIDDNAPASQVKDLLAKYKAVQKAKQAKLEAAQADLKKVLTTKQEAEAVLAGLVN
jgi:hypothetical protein